MFPSVEKDTARHRKSENDVVKFLDEICEKLHNYFESKILCIVDGYIFN
jgi:hypothetical protein